MTMGRTNALPRSYRGDIDGLRAIAVSLVVACHIGFHHFDAGFIGVDVFFVISGFLITSILLRELESGSFSISAFYERRARRILPALLAMLVITTLAVYKYTFPVDTIDYAHSLSASVLSYANIYFWHQAGYFDVSSIRRPLLHTWSLAVEEQFYLAFPLLLALVYKYFKKHLKPIFSLVACVSFLSSAILVIKHPSATFFLAGTRAWELLVGSLIAFRALTLPESRKLRNLAGAAGLLLLLMALILIDETTPFPGLAALLPCLGAGLVLMSGSKQDTLVSKMLSFKPFAFIGLISYSLYLWHWPLIVLRQYGFKENFPVSPHGSRILVLAESFLLGYLSWKLVETPFRSRSRISVRRLLWTTGAAAFALIAAATVLIRFDGLPQRFPQDAVVLASFVKYGGDHTLYREDHCFLTEASKQPLDRAMCLQARSSTEKPLYLLAGSSHAAHLWTGLSIAYPGIEFQQATASGCPLLLDQRQSLQAYCVNLNEYLFTQYLPSHRVDAVVLSHFWQPYDLPGLQKTLDYLTKIHVKVFVVGPIETYDSPLPEILARAVVERKDAAGVIGKHLEPLSFEMDVKIAQLVQHYPSVSYISLIKILCPEGQCKYLAAPLVPLQSDSGHLTRLGSIAVAQLLYKEKAFDGSQASLPIR